MDGRGSPTAVGGSWPRSRWEAHFPRHRGLFRELPDVLDREAVRRVALVAAEGESESERAFLATMAWGYGRVGYGPHRTANMLGMPDTRSSLVAAARSVRKDEALRGYERLAGDCRIKGLGPGLRNEVRQRSGKRLTASQPPLIHDDLVASWLRDNGRPDLSASAWSARKYAAYLDQIQAWADALDLDPETVEYLIFQSRANQQGNQWANG